MPKKAAPAETADQKVLVKFHLSPNEHRLLKALAAIGDVTIAEFCQRLIIEKVRALTAHMNLPVDAGDKPRRS